MLLEMTDEKAIHMLALSRELHWDFPSSQGTPIIKAQATSQRVEQVAQERETYANAARVLLEKGDEEDAVEIAANASLCGVDVAEVVNPIDDPELLVAGGEV